MSTPEAEEPSPLAGRPSKKPSLAKRATKSLGISFTLLCLVFVGMRIQGQWYKIADLLSPQILGVTAVGIAVYLGANFFLSYAWYRLLLFCGGEPPNQLMCHVVYGTTQIGKYLPGNVFHFVGRQLVGRAAKMNDSSLALSSLLEIVTFPAAAGAVSLVAGGTAPFEYAGVGLHWLWIGGAAIGIGVAVLPRLVPIVVRKLGLPAADVDMTVRRLPLLLVPLGSYVAFLIVSAAVCVALAFAATDADVPVRYLVACYPVAWLLGFVVPGASGGIGVREAVLILLLGQAMGEPVVLVMATVFRVVTIAGEVAFFFVARGIGRAVPAARPMP